MRAEWIWLLLACVMDGFASRLVRDAHMLIGDAFIFQPKDGRTQKPYVFVSGDNGNTIFALVPTSEDKDDWTYNKVRDGVSLEIVRE